MKKHNRHPKHLKELRTAAEAKLAKRKARLRELSKQDVERLVHELGTHQIELEIQNEELRRAQEELEESHRKYADLYDFAPVGYFTLDRDGVIIEANHAGALMLGRRKRSLISIKFSSLVAVQDQPVLQAHIEDVFKKLTRRTCELRLKMLRGDASFVQLQSIAMGEEHPVYMRVAVIDITERKHAELEREQALAGEKAARKEAEESKLTLRYQASHDTLTGLPNRMLFMDRLNLELVQARRNHTLVAVMFLDIDRFKNINDTLGHSVGDKLLTEVAGRLKTAVRESDTVCRMGGDEFTILLPELVHAEDAAAIARKVLRAFEEPFTLNRHNLRVTTSIGISLYPHDSAYADDLLKHADIAMYHAKDLGRNNYQFYSPDLNIRTIERMILESSLRQTLERGELVVYYQPQMSITRSGNGPQLVCAEALVRWRHPDMGLLIPEQFIPLAEEIGFIVSIDEWVLYAACKQNKAWQDEGHPSICVTVNLSARQFHHPGLAEMVAKVLQETGLAPRFLGIEITEGIAMQDTEITLSNMRALTGMGVRLSIDDFGTGFSSLGYLKKMPISKIKIDKSFIRDIPADADDRAIVSAVIALAHTMELRVVAEGVETEEQLSSLLSNGCDEAQGYFFSEPLSAEEFQKTAALYR